MEQVHRARALVAGIDPVSGAGCSRLDELHQIANDAGAAHVAGDALALNERIRAGLFYVACVGQFKRGKSTLLNALVGEPILPVGVVPVTAVVTVVRHGRRVSARVRMAGGDWQSCPVGELAALVTEEQNPENRKGVVAVEVSAPSELLATGMCLVDTPGIGSVFGGNTEATRAFVPHIDAALIVLGADPPLSGDELVLIVQIARQCRNLIFVMNKVDKLTDAEREEADRFTRRVLGERAGLKEVSLYDVSAVERLEGRGPERGWSGLTGALRSLARQSGSELVQAAKDRGLALLAERLRRHLGEQAGALLRPVEESERRVGALRACVAEAERSLNDLGYLFLAEQERLARNFARQREEFLQRAIPAARSALTDACRKAPARSGHGLRSASVKLAQEIATRHLDAWLSETAPAAEKQYAAAMDRFADLSTDYLTRLKRSAGSLLEALPSSVPRETGFRWDSRLFYKDLFQDTGEGPLAWLFDLFRTRSAALRSIEGVTGRYLQHLLEANATRIENDLNERVIESKRRFQFELRSLLQTMLESATGSLARARDLHAQGSEAVRAERERIQALSDHLQVLRMETQSPES